MNITRPGAPRKRVARIVYYIIRYFSRRTGTKRLVTQDWRLRQKRSFCSKFDTWILHCCTLQPSTLMRNDSLWNLSWAINFSQSLIQKWVWRSYWVSQKSKQSIICGTYIRATVIHGCLQRWNLLPTFNNLLLFRSGNLSSSWVMDSRMIPLGICRSQARLVLYRAFLIVDSPRNYRCSINHVKTGWWIWADWICELQKQESIVWQIRRTWNRPNTYLFVHLNAVSSLSNLRIEF